MALASRLKNRIEIFRRERIEGTLGDTYEDKPLKKVWADIMPAGAGKKSQEAETERVENKFKIIVRKTDIKHTDFIMFEGEKYEIEYITRNFNDNSYLEIFTTLTRR